MQQKSFSSNNKAITLSICLRVNKSINYTLKEWLYKIVLGQHRPDAEILDKEIACIHFAICQTSLDFKKKRIRAFQ